MKQVPSIAEGWPWWLSEHGPGNMAADMAAKHWFDSVAGCRCP